MAHVTDVVLLSGGYDSAFCALQAAKVVPRDNLRALFLDYGQPYAAAETVAAQSIAAHIGIALVSILRPAYKMNGKGVFEQRNHKLVIEAMALDMSVKTVWFGARNPLPMFDRFRDSNLVWACAIEAHYGITMRLPCMCLPKWVIKSACEKAGIASAVFSTEGWKPA